jgi:NADH:ubiquinone oxidoreductase subunit H
MALGTDGTGGYICQDLLFHLCIYVDPLDAPAFPLRPLMHLGWKSLIPLSILNMLLTGAGILWLG